MPSDKTMKILIACGASGGHVFPALSFAKNLRADYPSAGILFLSTPKCKESIVSQGYEAACILALKPYSHPLARVFAALWVMSRNILSGCVVLSKFNPDIVVGFGSYSCVPVMLLAVFSGKKTLLHEQNVLPGLATRILAPFVTKLAYGFADTVNYISPRFREKIVFTGNPVREELLSGIDRGGALVSFGLDSRIKTLLVAGGSQGSRRVNDVFLECASLLRASFAFQVIHICGKGFERRIKERYDELGVPARVFCFLDGMLSAYSAADIVVSRAGAMAVSEIIAQEKPSVLLPYPYAREHQLKNARVLSDREAAFVIRDVNLNALILKEKITLLLSNPGFCDKFKVNLKSLRNPNAGRLFLDCALSLFRE